MGTELISPREPAWWRGCVAWPLFGRNLAASPKANKSGQNTNQTSTQDRPAFKLQRASEVHRGRTNG